MITTHRVVDTGGDEPAASTIVTVLQQIGSRMPTSETETANLRGDLIRAGFRSVRTAI